MNTAPLQGIKVVDFTAVQSGPSCTQLLAWLGADVIKIERPGTGDATRDELQFDPDCPSYYFLQLNSNKKSLALDAATPDGKDILTRLIKEADIFIENLHPGAMDKLGFSWEAVHAINPRCIYGTIKRLPPKFAFRQPQGLRTCSTGNGRCCIYHRLVGGRQCRSYSVGRCPGRL